MHPSGGSTALPNGFGGTPPAAVDACKSERRKNGTGAPSLGRSTRAVHNMTPSEYTPADTTVDNTWDEMLADVERALAATAPEPDPPRGTPGSPGTDGPTRKSQATLLAELGDRSWRIVRDPTGEVWAIPRTGPAIARPLRGRGSLRAELLAAWRAETGKVATASAASDALLSLAGAASGPPMTIGLRSVTTPTGILVDLAGEGGPFVAISPGAWSVVDTTPPGVAVHRTALTSPLPAPARPGRLDDLQEFLHTTPDDWPVLCAWLVSALLPDRPCPVLLLHGQQGAGKSSATEALVDLVDPSAATTRAQPRDDEAWSVGAAGSRVVAVDNVSYVPTWWSDAICRAVTGAGMVRRELYTDSELSVLAFKRAIILNGIEFGALRPDLADRTAPVALQAIPPAERREASDLASAWVAARPGILAGLCDLTAAVLAHMAHHPAPRPMPRMADFWRVLCAVDAVLGTEGATTYTEAVGNLEADMAEGDAVAVAVAALLDTTGGTWRGAAAELYCELTPEHAPKSWPADPTRLSGRITRSLPLLARLRISATQWRTKDARGWELRRLGGDAGVTLGASGDAEGDAERHPVTPGQATNAPQGDAGDAKTPTPSVAKRCAGGEMSEKSDENRRARNSASPASFDPGDLGRLTAYGMRFGRCATCGQQDSLPRGASTRKCRMTPKCVGTVI